MNNKLYGKLIFELSHEGRKAYSLPSNKYGNYELPADMRRQADAELPECDELTVVRHYTNMSGNNFGVDNGFYPLGSCTMKYNPYIDEEIAARPEFTAVHPAQPADTCQGALAVYYNLQKSLAAITGLSEFTLNPFAGAHGELTGLMIIRTYHESRGDFKRVKVIVPDSAHGTNPASAAVCGLEVVEVKSNADGTIDIDHLRGLLDDTVTAIMMTNPNTLGLFEPGIPEIAKIVHECGALLYYDGANLNPMLGASRPGDMGFDVMHINLHKTFSTPHGGGGPGAGPVGVRAGLEEFLPNPQVVRQADGTLALRESDGALGQISSHLGNFAVLIRAYTYLLSVGRQHLRQVGQLSVLNANYIKESLKAYYELPIGGLCKHEFVFDGLRPEYGGAHSEADHIRTLDVAKRLLDYGFHAPTVYFPLLFHEAMMIEPTESESKETLDAFIDVMKQIAEEAKEQPDTLRTAPHATPVRRLDDVKAVKEPRFTYFDYEQP